MGHEVTLYGMIDGATYRSGEEFRLRQDRNRAVIEALPLEDEWPWLTRQLFALPGAWPQGTYQGQVIHFGLSMKDDPGDQDRLEPWLLKFEQLLSRMFWFWACVHIMTEFEPELRFEWTPTESSLNIMCSDAPQPITGWTRIVTELLESTT